MKSDKVAVLCDFDGTICPVDVLHLLWQRFGSPKCQKLTAQWERGEITTQQLLEGGFATVSASREEMEAYIDSVQLDPAFTTFVRCCREANYELSVVSDGLTWYIDRLLRNHGIVDLQVCANYIRFTPGHVSFDFPWHDEKTPMYGTSKAAIVRSYQARGWRVISIGDGLSDVEAAREADEVYARGLLLEIAHRNKMVITDFLSFKDLTSKIFGESLCKPDDQ